MRWPRSGGVIAEEGIDCGWLHSGSLMVATSAPQVARLHEGVERRRRFGMDEDDLRLLEPPEIAERVRVAGSARRIVHTALRSPRPGAAGARAGDVACERRGVIIYERTTAESIEPGRVRCATGTLRAGSVLRATEAYTVQQPGQRRLFMPLYSLMIATEPLPAGGLGRARLGRPRDRLRPAPPVLLRPAHPRRPHRHRRARRALPAGLADRRGLRAQRRRARAPRAHDRGALPGGGGRRDHASLGRPARRAARLVLLGLLRPGHGLRLGRRLHRARRRHEQRARAARSPISCCGETPTSSRCRGSGTRARAGSPSRCASWPRARS